MDDTIYIVGGDMLPQPFSLKVTVVAPPEHEVPAPADGQEEEHFGMAAILDQHVLRLPVDFAGERL